MGARRGLVALRIGDVVDGEAQVTVLRKSWGVSIMCCAESSVTMCDGAWLLIASGTAERG